MSQKSIFIINPIQVFVHNQALGITLKLLICEMKVEKRQYSRKEDRSQRTEKREGRGMRNGTYKTKEIRERREERGEKKRQRGKIVQ